MAAADGSRVVPALPWPSDAVLTMPGSKSAANRLLVAAALSGREVTITGASPSDDVRHLVHGLRTLGFAAHFDEAVGRVVVGPRRGDATTTGELHCGNAGTALRFLVSVAAITPGEWTLTGDAAMQRRPVGPLCASWRQLGVDVADTGGCPPVRVRGRADVRGGAVTIDASASGQFVSSLLLVGSRLPLGLDVRFAGALASADYVRWTCALLARCGVHAALRDGGASVQPAADGFPATVAVEGDWSSMGVWTCLAHLTGSRLAAANLDDASHQPDAGLAATLRSLPPAGEHALDAAALPDQFPNLAIVAAYRAGTTRLVGGANLRRKESDRIAVMARELRRVGVVVDELADGLAVHGGRPLRPAVVDPERDHRIAMAFALAGLLSPGITIADPGCVAKSYPGFWSDLDTVVRSRRCVAVVGMRGAGKSTFARAFAAATGVECVDTDERFVAAHGPIAAFVAAHGWPAFRRHEQQLVAGSIAARRVVATGGGAIERDSVRTLLRDRTFVVWLDGDPALLRARLSADAHARPALHGGDALAELEAVAARRAPLYAEVAHLRLDASWTTARQVETALAALGATCRWPGHGGAP